MNACIIKRVKTVFLVCSLIFSGACSKDDNGDGGQPVVPIISDFTPTSGQVGDEIAINGKHFSASASGNVVKFNDIKATVKAATMTQLIVTVPEGAATGKVSVTVNGEVGTSLTDFTVLFSPKITVLSVDNGYVGDQVTIEGENFDSNTSGNEVLFNGTSASVTSATETALVVIVPEGATTGNIKVTVNGMTTTSSEVFTVNQPPSISGFSPLSGIIGEGVTIEGEHFSATASENEVLVNGMVANLISASETTLVVVVPEGANTGKISVTVDGKEVISGEDFTVLPLKQIEAGGYHTLMVKSDNTLWGFGWNYHGQLGVSGQDRYLQAVHIMSDVKTVAAGERHTLILKTDNTLWVTGRNTSGELGDGTQTDVFVPKQIMTDVKAIAAGQAHSLILKTDNTLWGTGSNSFGQLGNGGSGNIHLVFQQVMTDVRAIAAGAAHSLVVKEDNTLWVTGFNGYGQLGDGTLVHITTLKQVMSDVLMVSAGHSHSLVVKTDKTLWGMGHNEFGQLRGNETENVLIPKQIMAGVAKVSAGYVYTLILDQDQTLWGLGNNEHGLFHSGTTEVSNFTPVQMMGNVKLFSTGNSHSMIYRGDNTLWSAGNNSYGQLGDGSTTSSTNSVGLTIP